MHVRRALALTLAVPVLLAGCSDDPEPKPKIPETTSSSPTPTPTESETPEAESPEDFIRRWVEAGDEMQVTGETAEYRRIVAKCKAVRGVRRQVDDVYGQGGSVEFAGIRSQSAQADAAQPPTYRRHATCPDDRHRYEERRARVLAWRTHAVSGHLEAVEPEWRGDELRDPVDEPLVVSAVRLALLAGLMRSRPAAC